MKTSFEELQNEYVIFVKLFLKDKDDINKLFQLKKNIISLLDKTLENFHSLFMSKIKCISHKFLKAKKFGTMSFFQKKLIILIIYNFINFRHTFMIYLIFIIFEGIK